MIEAALVAPEKLLPSAGEETRPRPRTCSGTCSSRTSTRACWVARSYKGANTAHVVISAASSATLIDWTRRYLMSFHTMLATPRVLLDPSKCPRGVRPEESRSGIDSRRHHETGTPHAEIR